MAHGSVRHNAASKTPRYNTGSSRAQASPSSRTSDEHGKGRLSRSSGAASRMLDANLTGHNLDRDHFFKDQDFPTAMNTDAFWNMIEPYGDQTDQWMSIDQTENENMHKDSHQELFRAKDSMNSVATVRVKDYRPSGILTPKEGQLGHVPLPVSSSSSDITESGLSTSDGGQGFQGSWNESRFTAASAAFAPPASLPVSLSDNWTKEMDPIWSPQGLTTMSDLTDTSPRGTRETSQFSGLSFASAMHDGNWIAGSQVHQTALKSPCGRGKVGSTAMVPTSSAMSDVSGAYMTSRGFSAASPESPRSSFVPTDNHISVDLNGLSIAPDFTSASSGTLQAASRLPLSPEMSVYSAGSSLPDASTGLTLSPSDLTPDGFNDASLHDQPSSLQQQSIEDAENNAARGHPLYHRAADRDGMFHCPYEGQDGCNHKPVNLKCNYDKYVDSHLRPYRCKVNICNDQKFSSTACLLRHERETHGMHGHGAKPFTCHFEGCERALEGSGFPRRWNLLDHMRRVHNYSGDEPARKGSISSSSGAPDMRKRKPLKTQAKTPTKKNKSGSGQSAASTNGVSARKQAQTQRNQHIRSFNAERENFASISQQYLAAVQAQQSSLTNEKLALHREGLLHLISGVKRLQDDLNNAQKVSVNGQRRTSTH